MKISYKSKNEMENFYNKIECRLRKHYDKKTSAKIAKKLTKMFPKLWEYQTLPENKKIIKLIEKNDADFDIVRRCLDKVFDREIIKNQPESNSI